MINLREFFFGTLSFFMPKILKIFQFPVTTPLPPRYSSERRYLPWDLTISIKTVSPMFSTISAASPVTIIWPKR